jgi:anion-transporting  ArsA/GET3 family ATPase
MALMLTFLGKGGTGKSTIAIAAAKKFAASGKRVLLATQDPGPTLGILLGTSIHSEPQEVAPNFKAVQFLSTLLLEKRWEQLKSLESQYVRNPFFKQVYGQELGILPGMDSFFALDCLRDYDTSNEYDVIVYDGTGSIEELRMLGTAEILGWYVRRFRQVLADSDLGKSLSPFVQPVISTVLNVDWSGDNFSGPAQQINSILDKGKAALEDPQRLVAYLVTNGEESAIATARYLWGSAQQVGLIIGGAIVNQATVTETIAAEFTPLTSVAIPTRSGDDWAPIQNALPDFSQAVTAPRPININVSDRQVSLFLPGFDKKQIKLTQSGPEVTIEAGDQRRNILLPPELTGKSVTGAKFQNSYLIISF